MSLRIGNLILGNEPNSPALEMTLVGGEFEFEESAIIAITGSDFHPTMNGESVALWTSVPVNKGQVIRFAATAEGARCYVCIRGGFSIPPVMGSASTHLFTGIGGWKGRALQKDDCLPYFSSDGDTFPLRHFPRDFLYLFKERGLLHVTEGPQQDQFSLESQQQFFSSGYEVSEAADRMGLRLVGPALSRLTTEDMMTEGASLGAIQVTHDGQPIILFVEHQTTGGYPKIANVISSDLHRVGQLRPRDPVRFQFVSLQEAQSLQKEKEALLHPW